jgi:hypothetical protein
MKLKDKLKKLEELYTHAELEFKCRKLYFKNKNVSFKDKYLAKVKDYL